jgi:hypothetical protein
MAYVMFVIMFGNFELEMYSVNFDSQLTCENAKTAIVEQYDKNKVGVMPVIMCVRK